MRDSSQAFTDELYQHAASAAQRELAGCSTAVTAKVGADACSAATIAQASEHRQHAVMIRRQRVTRHAAALERLLPDWPQRLRPHQLNVVWRPVGQLCEAPIQPRSASAKAMSVTTGLNVHRKPALLAEVHPRFCSPVG